METIKFYNGVVAPTLSYGTWLIKNEDAARCVKLALKHGYRHIDTAQAYGNEVGVGQGIKESGLKREEIFVTTKVMAEYKTYKEAKESIDYSLQRLGLSYVDLLLIHCPQPWDEFRGAKKYFEENVEVWKALEEAYKEGKARAIGVSNFLIEDIVNITSHCEIKPMANQILLHIGSTPMDVVKYCQENDIVIESYSPIAHGRLVDDPRLVEMAKKYNVSIPQLCIKYTLQLNTITIPKASSEGHIKDNAQLGFEISKEDMIELIKLNEIDYGEDSFWPVFSKKNH